MSSVRTVAELLRWSAGWWLLWAVPRPGSAAGAGTAAVSVVVPARDEEENLGRLLPALAGQVDEVVVVDDGSVDATSRVAGEWGARVVEPGPPPPGWTGKAWACAAGAQRSTAAVLAFLDADTVPAPGAMARLVAEQAARGGLVSVQPRHVTHRAHEQLSAFFNLVAMMGLGAFTPLGRRRPPAGAFGPCMVLDRATYEAAGGHAAVRGEVLDDVALARAVVATGAPVTLFGGGGTIDYRMYPRGLGQLIEGWTKNIAGGAAGTRPLTLVLVVAWISGAIAAAAGLVWSRSWPALLLYAAYAVQLAALLGRVGRFHPATAAAFPVPLAFFLWVFARSTVATYLRGRVAWRGRSVPTGRRR